MRCESFIKCSVLLLLVAACSRETPAPMQQTPTTTSAATPAPAPAPAQRATYEDAMNWFRTTPGFHFVAQEGTVRAEGDVERERVGAERVRMTIGGEAWAAESGARGVVWSRNGKEAPAPENGNRLFQRVTVAFDPQKTERQAQLVEPNHFRFTDANSGAVHDVWVTDEGRIAKMTIGETFSMTLSAQK